MKIMDSIYAKAAREMEENPKLRSLGCCAAISTALGQAYFRYLTPEHSKFEEYFDWLNYHEEYMERWGNATIPENRDARILGLLFLAAMEAAGDL